MKSHFETLGLLPSLIGKLETEQIQDLVKEASRALNFIFHPDRNDGDVFQSTLINEAMRQLASGFDIEDAKQKYLESGPGREDIRRAEGELQSLGVRLEAVERVLGKSEAQKNEITEEMKKGGLAENYAVAFYSNKRVSHHIPVDDLFSDVMDMKESQAIPLRFAPGAKIKVVTPEAVGIIESLNMLPREDEINKDEMLGEIADTRRRKEQWESEVDFYKKKQKKARSKEKREENKERLEWTEARLEETNAKLGRQEEMFERALGRREKLEKRLEQEKKNGDITIAEDGQIIVDGKDSGFVVGGSSIELENTEVTDGTYFSPFLIEGEALLGVDRELKTKTFGVTQKIELEPLKIVKGPERQEVEWTTAKRAETAPKKKESQVEEEESKEKAMVPQGSIRGYKTNPFETLGLLPMLVRKLDDEGLRMIIKYISKSLKKSFHPDRGGDEHEFALLSAALEALEKPEIFERAKAEYARSKPDVSEIVAIEKEIEVMQEMIREQIPEMAAVKAEEKKAMQRLETKRKAHRRFLRVIVSDAFGAAVASGSAGYLRRSEGMDITISHDKGMETLRLEKEGFDVFASGMMIIGSTAPGEFRNLDAAREKIDGMAIEDIPIHTEPLVRKGSCLVGVREGMIEALGMIESIERGKELAKKLGKKSKEAKPKKEKRKIK